MCVGYGTLSDVASPRTFPLPEGDDVLRELAGAHVQIKGTAIPVEEAYGTAIYALYARARLVDAYIRLLFEFYFAHLKDLPKNLAIGI